MLAKAFQCYIAQFLNLLVFYFFGPPPLGEKGFCNFTTVSMSVGKRIFSKMPRRIFLKLLMK